MIPAFSFNKVSVNIPTSWEAMSVEDMKYIYELILQNVASDRIKIYFFIRKNKIKILRKTQDYTLCKQGKRVFTLKDETLLPILTDLDFISRPYDSNFLFPSLHSYNSINPMLIGLPFKDYLALENLYQGFILSQDIKALSSMAKIIYPGYKGNLPEINTLNITYWYTHIKTFFSKKWTYLFKPSDETSNDIETAMNNQIRALTNGDITKEDAVLSYDCWRALTELNEKAREAQELNSKSLK